MNRAFVFLSKVLFLFILLINNVVCFFQFNLLSIQTPRNLVHSLSYNFMLSTLMYSDALLLSLALKSNITVLFTFKVSLLALNQSTRLAMSVSIHT